MTDHRASALKYAQEHRARFLDELKIFAAIPSISTDPSAKADIQRAAEWVAKQLVDLGMDQVQIMPTTGHPVVYGEILTSPDAPTVLIYGHYDVQPADPLDLWESDAFEPTIRGDNIYARGITDMKGQVMASLKAVESIVRTGRLSINIKFLIEGEEEIGSPSLSAFMEAQKDLLRCDFALNPDTGIIAADLPTITYALRGLAAFELRVHGPDHDLHSGVFGGIVHNPAQALCELIAGMHDDHGQVTLPGFYDRVFSLSDEERSELARLPMDEKFYLKNTGAPALYGEETGFTPIERIGARPTLEINGIHSGYAGEGIKTVIPTWAMAKISCRLVPEQDPDEVYMLLRQYLEDHAPTTIRWELIKLAGGAASISDRHSPWVQALSKAMESVWGTCPVFKREGGSVPVVTQFQQILGVEAVNTGFALPDDNFHSPNEKMNLPTWYRGIDTFIHLFFNLGEHG